MGKRRKGKCVKNNKNVYEEPEEIVQAPHSFVIHKGLTGGNIVELTKDFRKVMEPFTAAQLKERKKNSIKDFVSIAGILHVSHLCIFSQTELGMYFKLCKLPKGPSLTFKIHQFSLARDVISSLKKQFVVEEAFKHSPLIVMNSFTGEGMHIKLMASVFQNLFPTINLTNVDLNTIRRCVLLNYNPTSKLIDFRHYAIKIIPVGVSKGVKKVVQGKVPDLSRCTDISELLTKGTMLSESEAEDDPNHHVILPQKIVTRGNIESGKSSIRLSELGPRMSLQLIKIEDGLLDGEVLYHDIIQKTDEEKLEIQKRREAKRKLKEKRRRIQEENKKAKEQIKQENKEKSLKGMQKNNLENDKLIKEDIKEANESIAEPEDDDVEYYKEEVGEEPDKDLFRPSQTGTKRPKTFYSFKNKKMKFNNDNSNEYQENKNNKFKRDKNNKSAGRRKVDKTNSQNRDQRPIGGKYGTKFRFSTSKLNKMRNKK